MAPNNTDGSSGVYYRNTGVVNIQVIGDYLIEDVILDVFVHELGHSLGAKHDDMNFDCNALGFDNYLMTGNAKVRFGISIPFFFNCVAFSQKILMTQITHQLSVCSNREIGKNLDRVTCWQERQGPAARREKARLARVHNAKEIALLILSGSLILFGIISVLFVIIQVQSCVANKTYYNLLRAYTLLTSRTFKPKENSMVFPSPTLSSDSQDPINITSNMGYEFQGPMRYSQSENVANGKHRTEFRYEQVDNSQNLLSADYQSERDSFETI